MSLEEQPIQEVTKTYETCLAAWKASDLETLKGIYHPQYTVFFDTGEPLTGIDWTGEQETINRGIQWENTPDLDVKVYGTAAIAAGTEKRVAIFPDGRREESTYRVSITWIQESGKWWMLHEHQSPLSESSL